MEAEYIALLFAVREALWIQQLIVDTGIRIPAAGIQIYCENQETIALSNNEFLNACTKHIDIKFNCVKKNVNSQKKNLFYIKFG